MFCNLRKSYFRFYSWANLCIELPEFTVSDADSSVSNCIGFKKAGSKRLFLSISDHLIEFWTRLTVLRDGAKVY